MVTSVAIDVTKLPAMSLKVHEPALPPTAFSIAVAEVRTGTPLLQSTRALLSKLSIQERLALLDGDVPFWQGLEGILCDRYNRHAFIMGENRRLGIPGIRFTDGPRGVVMGSSTAFPVAMARGATWDTRIEEQVGRIIGMEGRAQGANLFAGICINLPRHPAWGRIQETYSEDPLLLGEFGAALARGVRENLMTCVKHFALNSMEEARFSVNVIADERALHEVYLPHFRQLVIEGVDCLMASYNSVNGEWAGQNTTLLTSILREQWNFDGFTMTDFIFGLRNAALSVKAGLDLEAPFMQQRSTHLPKALELGKLSMGDVEQACLRILSKQIQYAVRIDPRPPPPSIVFCDAHRVVAREVAACAMVLLENRKINDIVMLPLHVEQEPRKVAVIGRLANRANTGDRGSSAVFSPQVISPWEGIRTAMSQDELFLDDADSVESAAALAAAADIAILLVGYDANDEGEYVVPALQVDLSLRALLPPAETTTARALEEQILGQGSDSQGSDGLRVGDGGDRRSLRLRSRDVEIIEATCRANPRTIVAIVAAGAVIVEEWKALPAAIIVSWYAGCEGGHALADVILGKIEASGRLPFSIPRAEQDLPYFDPHAEQIEYDIWFGQRLLDRTGAMAAYPLGFGLSYTAFSLCDIAIASCTVSNKIAVSATVQNTGHRKGRFVVQVYGTTNMPDFPRRVLLGFRPVDLEIGDSEHYQIDCSLQPLMRWSRGGFHPASQTVGIELGGFAGDPDALTTTYKFPDHEQQDAMCSVDIEERFRQQPGA